MAGSIKSLPFRNSKLRTQDSKPKVYLRPFYEARPVNIKIRLIASSFYPSFHLWPNRLFIPWSHSTYATTPILRVELHPPYAVFAHFANRAVAQTIITNFKLHKQSFFSMFSGGEKKYPSHHAAKLDTFTFSSRHCVPSRSIAQQRISNFLATAVIAIFLREALPRKIR
jgi:hypothetical protein